MLHGKHISLRPMERDDVNRLWEFAQDIDLGILTGSDGRPVSLAAVEKTEAPLGDGCMKRDAMVRIDEDRECHELESSSLRHNNPVRSVSPAHRQSSVAHGASGGTSQFYLVAGLRESP